jgi:hypothetical protein
LFCFANFFPLLLNFLLLFADELTFLNASLELDLSICVFAAARLAGKEGRDWDWNGGNERLGSVIKKTFIQDRSYFTMVPSERERVP